MADRRGGLGFGGTNGLSDWAMVSLPMLLPPREMTTIAHGLVFSLALLGLLFGNVDPGYSAPSGNLKLAHDPWSRVIEALASGRKATRTRDGDTVTFVIFSRRRDRSLMAAISIGPKGTFFDNAAYDRRMPRLPRMRATGVFPPPEHAPCSPPVFFGPGDSSSTIVSTIFDERYDLKVTVANAGTAELEAPKDEGFFDVLAINERLHQEYAAKIRE